MGPVRMMMMLMTMAMAKMINLNSSFNRCSRATKAGTDIEGDRLERPHLIIRVTLVSIVSVTIMIIIMILYELPTSSDVVVVV